MSGYHGCARLVALLLPLAAAAAGARFDAAALVAALAGRYDNLAQVAAEQRAGVAAAHEPLALTITPVAAPLVGDAVLFVQESAAGDPRRVFSQRIWVLGADARRHVLHGIYRFAEPQRWRAGVGSPELFRALLARDLEPVTGCDVRWSRTARGLQGANDPGQCRVADAGGEPLRVEQIYELAGTTLAYSERVLDAAGVTVRGRAADAPYLFRRQP
ncbi:MAG: chromophore lyase CpcT/CpeT [Gammaproteobacteria bacterium]|nr:chromophore lyase CpcT/CpeT [Gammaproteobacteria bacterium]